MRIRFIQTIVDKLRNKIAFLDLFLFREKQIQNTKNFHTLILGSSHIYNYSPIEGELNTAIISQDLYSTCMLYKKLNHSNLKNIVISFSVFTPGFCLIKTLKSWQLCILYKLFFGIDYEYEEIAKERNLYKQEKHIENVINKRRKAYLAGKEIKTTLPKGTDIKLVGVRTSSHYKNNQREPDEMHWCEEIIKFANENGQNLFFYLPPAMKEYKDRLPSCDILFKKLFDMCKGYKNVHILNYYDSDKIAQSDFVDTDHITAYAWQNKLQNFDKSLSDKLREDIKLATV